MTSAIETLKNGRKEIIKTKEMLQAQYENKLEVQQAMLNLTLEVAEHDMAISMLENVEAEMKRASKPKTKSNYPRV